jgi:hypothetical protein
MRQGKLWMDDADLDWKKGFFIKIHEIETWSDQCKDEAPAGLRLRRE